MGVQVPELNTCFGTTLRTGCLIIFWISLIHGTLLMCLPPIQGGYKINSTASIVDNNPVNTANTANTVYEAPRVEISKLSIWLQTVNNLYKYYPDFSWFTVVLGALDVLFSAFGLYGTYKNLHEYLKPYIIWHLIVILMLFFECILYLFMIVYDYMFLYRATVVVVVSVFYVFFWLVAFNHYRALREVSVHTSAGVDYL